MSEFKVAKYGGTSMAQPEVVASVVESRPEQKVIVVSAPGKINDTDTKLTAELESYALLNETGSGAEVAEAADKIIERFDAAYSSLGSKALGKLRDKTADLLASSPQKDANFYVSCGEHASALYFSELIGSCFLEPCAVRFNNSGTVNYDKTLDNIVNTKIWGFRSNKRLIIPGFYGYDSEGKRQLLGRGGSDRTGALYAHALSWDYDNWTDQDGIHSADPKKVPAAKLISELTRNEVREGAHGGSGILQGDAIADLAGSDLVTTIKNTFNPDSPGTLVVPKREVDKWQSPVVAVSGRKLSTVSVYDIGMANARGYLGPIYDKAGELDISIEHSPTDQDAATFTFSEEVEPVNLEEFKEFIAQNTISPDAEVSIDSSRGVVYVVGEALRDEDIKTTAIGRVGLRLGSDLLGFKDMVSHEDSPSIALLTSASKVEPTMRSLHNEFIEE